MKKDHSNILLILVAAFLWGIGDFFSKIGVTAIGPWSASFIRSAFFLPIVLVYVLYDRDFDFSFDSASIYPMLAGLFIGLGIILSRLSLSIYEVSLVKPIQRLSILITVILSVVFLGEEIDKVKVVGVGLAVAAFFFLYPLGSEILHFTVGHLYLLGLILALGLSTVFLRLGILKKGVDFTRFFRAVMQTAIIFSTVIFLYGLVGLSITLNLDIIYPALNGIFGAVAFILFCRGLENVGASRAKPMMVLATITTVTLGVILLNENLFLSKMIGILLASLALILLSTETA
ncbi:MAG: DMT family transporter [Candidatus Thermoplasmatota archaeon]|nr:DMT family transporter [Candidatus Thermoplasmatota archaeon]